MSGMRLRCHRNNVSGLTIQPSRKSAGEYCGDSAEQAPVLVGEHRSVVLSAQQCVLVAQHDDLEIFRTSSADGETCQRGAGSCRGYETRRPSKAASVLVSTHAPLFRSPQGTVAAVNAVTCSDALSARSRDEKTRSRPQPLAA